MARDLPIVKPVFPPGLRGEKNGELTKTKLVAIEPFGKLYPSAAEAWRLMREAARLDEIRLRPTTSFDTYRPITVQRAVFRQRYTQEVHEGRPTRTCDGVVYWLRPGMSAAACPGTSNHGWGLAVDIWNVGKNGRLEWLLENALRFGFSWELQSEPWHLRYVLGDKTPKVAA